MATPPFLLDTATNEPYPLQHSHRQDCGASQQQPGNDLHVMVSGELIQALMARNLIDEYMLLIHPLVLGSGRRLFRDGGAPAILRLTESVTTTTGVVIATYQPAAS